jgi:hypothetical protein
MSETPIFDKMVAEFEARRGMKFQTLLAPKPVLQIPANDAETLKLFKVEKPITPVVHLSQRNAA